VRVIWPWQDRGHGWSWLKAGTFALMFAPAIWLIDQLLTGEFGPVPLGGLTYWSGLWATALLLLALAITPAVTILRFGRMLKQVKKKLKPSDMNWKEPAMKHWRMNILKSYMNLKCWEDMISIIRQKKFYRGWGSATKICTSHINYLVADGG